MSVRNSAYELFDRSLYLCRKLRPESQRTIKQPGSCTKRTGLPEYISHYPVFIGIEELHEAVEELSCFAD
jgi:hypothetical protein